MDAETARTENPSLGVGTGCLFVCCGFGFWFGGSPDRPGAALEWGHSETGAGRGPIPLRYPIG